MDIKHIIEYIIDSERKIVQQLYESSMLHRSETLGMIYKIS